MFVSVVSLLYQNTSFDVSIETKPTEYQPKQFYREHILLFSENLGFFHFFQFFSVFFFQNSLFRLFRFYAETESFDVSIEPKQTHPNSLKESIFGYFSENLGLFGLFCFTKQFCLFRLF
jgi:hypothetical protein